METSVNPSQPSYIEGTTELCTPAEVGGTCGGHDSLGRVQGHRLRQMGGVSGGCLEEADWLRKMMQTD